MSSKRAKHRKALREIAISNLKKDRNFFVVGLTYGCHKQWNGQAKPKREVFIDDVIPCGI